MLWNTAAFRTLSFALCLLFAACDTEGPLEVYLDDGIANLGGELAQAFSAMSDRPLRFHAAASASHAAAVRDDNAGDLLITAGPAATSAVRAANAQVGAGVPVASCRIGLAASAEAIGEQGLPDQSRPGGAAPAFADLWPRLSALSAAEPTDRAFAESLASPTAAEAAVAHRQDAGALFEAAGTQARLDSLASGDADWTFVLTAAELPSGVRPIGFADSPRVTLSAVATSDDPDAALFLRFLESDAGKSVFQEAGFSMP